jgi:octaprenyl-diphosphate synthase
VHDDVVDDANYRRGFFSINALFKNKIAILVGDYLLSRGLLLSIDNEDFDLLKIVSEAVREMSEGELLQIEKARKLNITEDIYYDIIKQKTASLIASCCAVGSRSVSKDDDISEKMKLFGEKVGMAFQIKDDLFDYGTNDIGKPVGIDIKEKKMTLPLIYALNNSDKSEQKHIIKLIKNKSEKSSTVKTVVDFVRSKNGIAYAEEVMHNYYDEAMRIIQDFPDSVYRKSLMDLVQYTIDRKK